MIEKSTFQFKTIKTSNAYDDMPGWRCDVGAGDADTDKNVIACCATEDTSGIPKSCFTSDKAIIFHPGRGVVKSINVGKDFKARCHGVDVDKTRTCFLESDLTAGPVLTRSELDEMLADLGTPRKGL